jgi:hypothetical protein
VTRVVCNVGVLTEGWDEPLVGCVILARPTKSLGLYLQMAGRGLRPAEGKSAVLLDHAGCVAAHGAPQDPREWSLAGKAKRAGATGGASPLKRCPECGRMVERPIAAVAREVRRELAAAGKARPEIELPVCGGYHGSAAAMLIALGLKAGTTVRKRRRQLRLVLADFRLERGGLVPARELAVAACLDEVEGAGCFVELEAVVPASSVVLVPLTAFELVARDLVAFDHLAVAVHGEQAADLVRLVDRLQLALVDRLRRIDTDQHLSQHFVHTVHHDLQSCNSTF